MYIFGECTGLYVPVAFPINIWPFVLKMCAGSVLLFGMVKYLCKLYFELLLLLRMLLLLLLLLPLLMSPPVETGDVLVIGDGWLYWIGDISWWWDAGDSVCWEWVGDWLDIGIIVAVCREWDFCDWWLAADRCIVACRERSSLVALCTALLALFFSDAIDLLPFGFRLRVCKLRRRDILLNWLYYMWADLFVKSVSRHVKYTSIFASKCITFIKLRTNREMMFIQLLKWRIK